VPKDFSDLTDYVAPEVPLFGRGTIVTTVFFFAPVDGSLRALSIDGQTQNLERARLHGRVAVPQTVALEPGQKRTVEVQMVSGPGQRDAANVQVTPGVRTTGLGTVSDSAC
jgi:hypothetical protein